MVEPFTDTLPTPLSIKAFCALSEFQVRLMDSPCEITSEAGVMVTVGGAWGSVTVIVTSAEDVPPIPVPMIVYVVVIVGETEIEPFTSTDPMSGSIVQVSV